MTTSSSVVTPERFAQGHDWDTYLSYIGSEENLNRPGPYGGARSDNSGRFTRNIEQYALKPEQAEALRALPAHKVLVLGEDWCPDVYRGLPVVAAMCAAAGWELRIFQRDDHKDMMAEFPNVKDGQEFDSIPVVVFYTADGFEEVARWIERPRLAEETMLAIGREFTRREGESDDEMRARLRQRYRNLQSSDEWDDWRHASVDEMLALLQGA